MTTQNGFTKMTVTEFANWIQELKVARTVLKIQQHHTYIPNYAHFDGSNHFARQQAMKNSHVNSNGWADIGQHFTIFPDGIILTGRSLEKTPACIYGQNANSVCIENLGYFDSGKDVMTLDQQNAIIAVTALLCKKFGLPVDTGHIVYHHWYRLDNGIRNEGNGNNKSCPGTNFFGGNKVQDCELHFLPLLRNYLKNQITPLSVINPVITEPPILKYVFVTASSLNIRVKPSVSAAKASDRQPALFGSVLRVYAEKNGWVKISGSKEHWVSGKYTGDVKKFKITTSSLNVRSGPGTKFLKTDSFKKDEEVFISEIQNRWAKIHLEEKWLSSKYLSEVL